MVSPSQLADAVGRIASSGNPFGEPRESRGQWAEALEVQAFTPDMDVLYSPCCVPSYDPRAKKVAAATVNVLRTAGVTFGILGDAESCCGEAIRRVGAEEVFQQVAGGNASVYAEAGVRTAVCTSPHCLLTFRREYGEFDAAFKALHQTQLFAQLIANGRLKPAKPLGRKVVYHDPCTLGRASGVYDEPRAVLAAIPDLELVEIPHYAREYSLCCGGGSGGMWIERAKGLLMERRGLSEAKAHKELRQLAMNTGKSLHEVAETSGLGHRRTLGGNHDDVHRGVLPDESRVCRVDDASREGASEPSAGCAGTRGCDLR